MSNPAIEVTDLGFSYPDGQRALDGLNLRVGPGERVAVLGPNGSGKTTLALHLNGILMPSSGSVRIGDLTVERAHLVEIRRRVGMVFQDSDDQLFMPSVREDVAFGPANLGLAEDAVEARTAAALEAVDATELSERAPHHLSGGEKRRAALATVLSMDPEVLVVDEPSSGLDPAGRGEVLEVLGSLSITQLVITHDLPFALQMCERAVIMAGGRVVADGPTSDLLADRDLLGRHRLE
jgi:cobalt/nickel transport system ATP-binding protein